MSPDAATLATADALAVAGAAAPVAAEASGECISTASNVDAVLKNFQCRQHDSGRTLERTLARDEEAGLQVGDGSQGIGNLE